MTTAVNDDAWGAEIVRGDDPGDHYTKIHNLLLRGKMLPPEYVGPFGYLMSHSQGWRVTEKQMMRDLGKGRTYVRSALAAMEKAGLLRRGRVRNPDGTLGASLWWVSGLAPMLRQLGLDEETVMQRVDEEAGRCFRSSQPVSRNATQATASENTSKATPNSPTDGDLSGSMPKSRYPTLDNPTLDNRPTKKNNLKKTNPEENQPTSPTPPGTAASSAAGAAEAGRQGADDFEPQKIQSGQADDAAHAQAAEIISAIDWPAKCRVDQGTQLRLVALASRCLAAGHSVGAVQAAVTEDLPAVWGAGLLVRRLQDLAENQRTDAGASSARVETPHQFEAGKSPGYCCVCGRRQENRLHRSLPQLPSEEQLAAEWLTLSGRRRQGHQPWRNPADQGTYDFWAPAEERATETAQAGDRCEHGRRVCVTCHGGKSGVSRPAPRPRSAAEQQLVEMSRGPAAA